MLARSPEAQSTQPLPPQTVGFLAVPVFDGSGNPDIAAKAKAQANPRQVVLAERMRKQFPVFIRMMLGVRRQMTVACLKNAYLEARSPTSQAARESRAEKFPALVSPDLANKSRSLNICHDTPVSPLSSVRSASLAIWLV
jgi:hypothetical protein